MTNIFYIHSHITFLSAVAVVEKLRLKNCVFLYGRNYNANFFKPPCQEIDFPKELDELIKVSTEGVWKPIWLYKKIHLTDLFLNKISNKDFFIYLPLTSNFLMQTFISNKFCNGFSIIEEGLLNYNLKEVYIKQTLPRFEKGGGGFINRNLRWIKHFNRSNLYFPVKAKLNKIYLFSKTLSFFDVNLFEKIQFPDISINYKIEEDTIVFIFDNPVEGGLLTMEDYLLIIQKIIKKYNREKFAFKFHPANQENNRFIELFESEKLSYIIIPNSIPLELVFINQKNIKVVGGWSSLLFYAALTGNMAVSYIPVFAEKNLKIKTWIDKLIAPEFFNKVKLAD